MNVAKKESKTNKFFHRAKVFLSKEIWSVQLKEFPIYKRLIYHTLRILVLAYKGFVEGRVNHRASALTYFTLMSIVPILAMGFGIAKGFGADKYLEKRLLEQFEGQEYLLSKVIDFSQNLLHNTGGGLIAGIGIIVLFYSVLKVFNHIERSFNDIWQIKTSRPYARKFADYLSMMLIAPVLLVAASGINVFIATQLDSLSEQIEIIGYITPFIMFLLKFLPYFIIWVTFTLLYIVLPNTKVNIVSGIIAGVIAGSAFMVVQWIYIDLQIGVSKYNAIYGSFAALPLFLAWLRISWLIVLLGAEISFSHQNQNLYEFKAETENISNRCRKILSVLLLNRIIHRFNGGEPPYLASELSTELKLPIRLTQNLLEGMVECNILTMSYTPEPKTPAFQPAQNIDNFTVAYVFNTLDASGSSISANNAKISEIESIYSAFTEGIKNLDKNILVRDIKV